MKCLLSRIVLPTLLIAAGCAQTPRGDMGASGDHRMEPYQPQGMAQPQGIPAYEGGLRLVTTVEGEEIVAGRQHRLAAGDQVVTFLRGIPRPEDIKNVVDSSGHITLPYIGQVPVAGLAASEAERLIEREYLQQGIFRNVNVIMVSEDKSYFVQGEVGRQGRFTMSGDVTLLKAITEAGGYTPFANRRRVKVIRGEEVFFFDAREIANGREPDPIIEANDIIVVLRSVF